MAGFLNFQFNFRARVSNIEQSLVNIFDAEYYLRHVDETAENIADPLSHYVEIGWRSGISPSPLFHVPWYLANNPDVKERGGEPLRHFIQFGAIEGRKPNPLFDPRWVSRTYNLSKKQNPLEYFITQYAAEHVNPHPLFSTTWYTERNPDVVNADLNPLSHFLMVGWKEGRSPNRWLDILWSVSSHKDFIESIELPEASSRLKGWKKGRSPYDLPRSIVDCQLNLNRTHTGEISSKHSGIFIINSQKIAISCDDLQSAASRLSRLSERSNVILFESHNFRIEGAPNSLFELAKGIQGRTSFQPLAASGRIGPMVSLYLQEAIDCVIHDAQAIDILSRETFISQVEELSNFYRSVGVRIIHANTLQSFMSVLAGARAGIPVLWNIRESENPDSYFDFLPDEFRSDAYSSFKLASAIVFVAHSTAKNWQPLIGPDVPVFTVPNGLDTARFERLSDGESRLEVRQRLGLRDSDVLILSVGSVVERKGQHDLAQALEVLSKAPKNDVRLATAFVGMNGGAYSQRLTDLAARMSSEKFPIHLIDESVTESDRREVAKLFGAADIFVLSSRFESYPRVILEAMSSKLAIVTTPCFGVTEQVAENKSALFYTPGNFEQLAHKIAMLIENPSLRRALTKAAHERFGELDNYETMLDSYIEIYNQILKND